MNKQMQQIKKEMHKAVEQVFNEPKVKQPHTTVTVWADDISKFKLKPNVYQKVRLVWYGKNICGIETVDGGAEFSVPTSSLFELAPKGVTK